MHPQYIEDPTAALSAGTRILAIANQKGGVGKTTTAVNLATALAACRKRVLIVDMDPQGNASTGLGVSAERRAHSIYDVLMDGRPLDDVVIQTAVPGMAVVASGVDLSGAELELVAADRREYRLRDGLEAVIGTYDYVLIDCPPALGLLTLNAFVAADAVLVPLQAEFYALEGLSHLLRTVERVKRGLNPKLEIQGIVLTMFDRRNNLCEMVAADVRKHLGDVVYDTMIPRNVRVSEAPSHGKPVLLYDMNCAGSQSYIRLAGEVLRREKNPGGPAGTKGRPSVPPARVVGSAAYGARPAANLSGDAGYGPAPSVPAPSVPTAPVALATGRHAEPGVRSGL